MGLDMYLTRKRNIYNWKHNDENKTLCRNIVDSSGLEINLDKLKCIDFVEEVCYWRKANSIHAYFVDNFQEGEDNCQETYIEEDSIRELLTLCKKVAEDFEKNQEMLPPQEGFFFGNTDDLEYYKDDINDTIEQLTEALENWDSAFDYYYRASW